MSSEVLLEEDGMHKLKKCNDDVSSFHSRLYIAIYKSGKFLCQMLLCLTTLRMSIFLCSLPSKFIIHVE